MIFCIFLCFYANSLNAQYTTIRSRMIYESWISLLSYPSAKVWGVVYEVKDSSICFSNSNRVEDYHRYNLEFTEVGVSDINLIQTRGKVQIRNGFLIGAAAGMVIGSVTGVLVGSNQEYQCEGDNWFACAASTAFASSLAQTGGAIMFGVFGIMIGGGIGAGIGASAKISIPINGSMENYNLHKEKLRRRSITYY